MPAHGTNLRAPCVYQSAWRHLFHPRFAAAWLPGSPGPYRRRQNRPGQAVPPARSCAAGRVLGRETRSPSDVRPAGPFRRPARGSRDCGRRCCRRSSLEPQPAALNTVPATAAAGDTESTPGRDGAGQASLAGASTPELALERAPPAALPLARGCRACSHAPVRRRACVARRVVTSASRPCDPCVSLDW